MCNHCFELWIKYAQKTPNQTGLQWGKERFPNKCRTKHLNHMIIPLLIFIYFFKCILACFAYFLFRFGPCDKLITILYELMTAKHSRMWSLHWLPYWFGRAIAEYRFELIHFNHSIEYRLNMYNFRAMFAHLMQMNVLFLSFSFEK